MEYDENNSDLEDFTGLQFTSGALVLPHFTASEETMAKEWNRHQGKPVIAIPERSGLLIESGQARVDGYESLHLFGVNRVLAMNPGEFLPADL